MGPTTIIIMSLYYFTTEQITIKSLSIQKNTFFHESDFATFDNVLLVSTPKESNESNINGQVPRPPSLEWWSL